MGRNAEGASKKALVAWNKICRRKEDGGMGIVCFELQAKTLKMRLVTKILEDENLDWVHIAKTILTWKVLDTKSRWEEVGRPIQEILLLGNRMRLGEAPTQAKILEGWWTCRPFLNLKDGPVFPSELSVERALYMLATSLNLKEPDIKRYVTFCSKAGIRCVSEIQEERVITLETMERQLGRRTQPGVAQGPLPRILWVITEVLQNRHSAQAQVANSNAWFWSRDGKRMEGWKHSTREWRWLLQETVPDESPLNRKWQCDWPKERWKSFWEKLWGSGHESGELARVRSKSSIARPSVPPTFRCHARQAWRERCSELFQGKRSSLPAAQIAQTVAELATEIEKTSSSRTKRDHTLAKCYLITLAEEEKRNLRFFQTPHSRSHPRGSPQATHSATNSDTFSSDGGRTSSSHSNGESEVSARAELNSYRRETSESKARLDSLDEDLERLGFLGSS
ncbi:hypothetical protein R1sor_020924 [Riccia sorocarpa]|uniref:Uncharacterized protein n=1 Tax=Riccia sorocarpa TaxID=122646 RepID=A0ABD3GFK1_9MARC